MDNLNLPKTTEDLRNDILKIMADLRNGAISNAVARSLLLGARAALETLRAEMEAARLGADFNSVSLSQQDRNTTRAQLRRVS